MNHFSAQDINIQYGNKHIIKNASFSLAPSQDAMLLGASGSGKSQLLLALADLVPHTGDLFLSNLHKNNYSVFMWRAQVMLILQRPEFIQGSVLDNLRHPFSFMAHKNKIFDKQWHLQKIHDFGKDSDFLNYNQARLSGGEAQMVNFLRTLQFNPKVLLLDEPTAALDSTNAQQLMQLYYDYKQNQNHASTCSIWITHNDNYVNDAQIWRMQNGILYTA